MEWNFREGIPIYSQIVEQVKIQIASGAYRPGDKLPSVRDLAVDAGVNPNTMQKALAQLEQEGLLHAVRTSGRFITEEESTLKDLKQDLGRKYIKALFESLSRLGMSKEEIIEAIANYKEES
ncbi:MAG: GntR family transcriptional regulator [Anaerovoracaceae bacterium]|jgi:GntR family transcriptional regulator